MIARTSTSFFLAGLITFGLFFFMQQITRTPDIKIPEFTFEPVVMGDIRRSDPPQPKILRPEKPEPVEIIRETTPVLEETPPNSFSLTPGPMNGPQPTGLPENNAVGFMDGEVYAITAIAPEYPAAAARLGLSGYVVVGFTVDKSGAVTDAYVIESSHRSFERSALRAIGKFKYKPKVVDGAPVTQGNLMYKFTFELEDDA